MTNDINSQHTFQTSSIPSADFSDKKAQRLMVRQRLSEATPQYLQTASAQIMQTLETLPEFQQAQCILLYWSLPQEVATHDFVEKWYLHKQILLPVMHGDGLLLRPFTGRENLVQRQFGVWEPITTTTIAETQTTPSTSEPIHTYEHPEEQSQSCSPCISSDQEPSYNPDLIIVPGVGFSPRGERLGHGKGFYDRLLAETPATKVGICFDLQLFDRIATQTHDIPMDKLLVGTPHQCILYDCHPDHP